MLCVPASGSNYEKWSTLWFATPTPNAFLLRVEDGELVRTLTYDVLSLEKILQ